MTRGAVIGAGRVPGVVMAISLAAVLALSTMRFARSARDATLGRLVH